MSIHLSNWRDSPGTKFIQNKNYISDTFISLIAQANAGDYNEKTYNQGVNSEYIAKAYKSPGNYRVPIYNPQKLYGGWVIGFESGSSTGQRAGNFGYGTIGGSDSYNEKYGAYCLDYMPRLYVKLKPLADYLTDLQTQHADYPLLWVYTGGSIYLPSGDGCQWGFKYDNPIDYTSFIEQSSGYYVCEQLQFYTDNKDGTTQTLLDGANISYGDPGYNCKYDVAQPLTIYPWNLDNGEWFMLGYYSLFMPNYGYIYNSGDMYPSIFGSVGLHSAIMTGAGMLSPLYNPGREPSTSHGWSSVPSSPRGAVCYATKEVWERLLNGGGCAWSYDLDKVTAPDDSGLHKPTTPGQPDNPVDDKEGTGDNISDTITYPAVSYVPSGYTKYWITPSQLPDLKQFLFSQTFFDNIQRLWQNPGEYIVDCTYYPVNPDLLGLMSVSEDIPIGNILSGVHGYLYPDTAKPYHFAGSVKLEPYYNSYLDYAPYTSVDIYIPYIGIRPLDVSRITGHTLLLAYSFDFSTRQITAHLGLDGDMTAAGGSLGNALDSFTGAFGISFPFSGTQNNAVALNVLQQTTGAISSLGAMVGGVATGNIAAIAGGAIGAVNTLQHGNLSPEVYGNLTPTAGLYAPQQPFLIINRPITAEPADFKNKQGYASCYSGAVSEFSGFLQCAAVDMPSAGTMTVAEQTEIKQLLLGGIYCG